MFKEINCIFSTDNFDSRQQFSLAQQFAMQSKLLPLSPTTAAQKQMGRAKLERVGLVGWTWFSSELSFKSGMKAIQQNI